MEELNYPDNLVLCLERDKRSYKAFTTEVPNKFKIINGLSMGDAVIDTKFIDLKELKQLFVDSCVNGYSIKTNLMFKQGLLGVAKELAKEYEERTNKEAEMTLFEDDEKVKVIYEEYDDVKEYRVVAED